MSRKDPPNNEQDSDYEIGQDNILVMGLDIHNPVFVFSVIVILAFLIGSVVAGESAATFFGDLRKSITSTFDWFFLIAANLFIFFCLFLVVTPLGKIKLGGNDAKPEYSTLSWFAMLFAAGMGIGLMFWSVAEPVVYASGVWGYAPLGVSESKEMAFATTIFHWGLHPWAIYAVVGLALAFFTYNRGLPLTIRSAFYPIFGEAVWGWVGHVIDTLAVFATIFGLATSLGLGAQQANAGLNYLFDIEVGASVQTILIVIITAAALTSVVAGLDKGVKRLSEFNISLAILLMIAVIVLGPTIEIITGFFTNTSSYLQNIVPLSNWIGREDSGFLHDWTTFYWAWWIAWSPFVGMFIARVSKGRTVREFVTCVLIVPTIVSILWMSAFGGSAIDQVIDQAGSLENAIVTVAAPTADDPGATTTVFNSQLAEQVNSAYEQAMFTMFDGGFPMAGLLSFIGIVLVITFFVTSSDSGSLVIDTITAGGKIDAPVAQRVLWCLLEGAIAIVLLWSGGLTALQAASVATGLPFAVILLFMCIALYKGLKSEQR
ncbi:MAG: BCCT family transporter [Gammaproteobacteria bacterium]|nr:BCCT family transporter [Gammaproteobacteria bacterium]